MLKAIALVCLLGYCSGGKVMNFAKFRLDMFGQQDLEQYCPAWGPWQESQCAWLDQTYESLPQACRPDPSSVIKDLPAWFQTYAQAKSREYYDWSQYEFKSRGSPQQCGYCSRRVRCRTRQTPSTSANNLMPWCEPMQAETVYDNRQCPGTQPCELTPVEGVCSPPLFLMTLESGKMANMGEEKIMKMIKKKIKAGKGAGPPGRGGHGGRGGRGGPFRPGGMSSERGTPDGDESDGMDWGDWDDWSEPEPEPEPMGMMPDREYIRMTSMIMHELLNGTNCAKDPNDSQKCLCCCGPYVPDLSTRECRDVTTALPTLKQILNGNQEMPAGNRQQGGPFFNQFIQPLLDATGSK